MKINKKHIRFYLGLYDTTEEGEIISFHNGKTRVIRQGTMKSKHKFVLLSKLGVQTNCYVHRLVAQKYHANPNNYPIVRHLDNNPSNNHKDNLEWCTNQTNCQQAHDDGLNPRTEKHTQAIIKSNKIKKSKPVMQLTKEGILCKIHASLAEASRSTGILIVSIWSAANGRTKKSGGYYWEYVNKNN